MDILKASLSFQLPGIDDLGAAFLSLSVIFLSFSSLSSLRASLTMSGLTSPSLCVAAGAGGAVTLLVGAKREEGRGACGSTDLCGHR